MWIHGEKTGTQAPLEYVVTRLLSSLRQSCGNGWTLVVAQSYLRLEQVGLERGETTGTLPWGPRIRISWKPSGRLQQVKNLKYTHSRLANPETAWHTIDTELSLGEHAPRGEAPSYRALLQKKRGSLYEYVARAAPRNLDIRDSECGGIKNILRRLMVYEGPASQPSLRAGARGCPVQAQHATTLR